MFLVLDPKDILQADATVIAGVLILISVLYALSTSSDSNSNSSKEMVIETRKRISFVTLAIIIPFSASAVSQIICPLLGELLMEIGFVALVIGIGVLLFSNLTVKIIRFRGGGA